MPASPPSICSQPGCNALTTNGRCDACKPRASVDHRADARRRGTAAQRGYDAKWRRLSENYRKAHPLCEMCCAEDGLITPATLVDHIVPVDVRPDLRLVEANLQSGCAECNARKRVADAVKYATVRAKNEGRGGVKKNQ